MKSLVHLTCSLTCSFLCWAFSLVSCRSVYLSSTTSCTHTESRKTPFTSSIILWNTRRNCSSISTRLQRWYGNVSELLSASSHYWPDWQIDVQHVCSMTTRAWQIFISVVQLQITVAYIQFTDYCVVFWRPPKGGKQVHTIIHTAYKVDPWMTFIPRSHTRRSTNSPPKASRPRLYATPHNNSFPQLMHIMSVTVIRISQVHIFTAHTIYIYIYIYTLITLIGTLLDS